MKEIDTGLQQQDLPYFLPSDETHKTLTTEKQPRAQRQEKAQKSVDIYFLSPRHLVTLPAALAHRQHTYSRVLLGRFAANDWRKRRKEDVYL